MKHNRSQLETLKSIRKSWSFNPETRTINSKKQYSRKSKFKQNYEE